MAAVAEFRNVPYAGFGHLRNHRKFADIRKSGRNAQFRRRRADSAGREQDQALSLSSELPVDVGENLLHVILSLVRQSVISHRIDIHNAVHIEFS